MKARLLEAVVTPTVLYAAGTWTLTKALEAQLVTAKRRMIRKMLGAARQPEETWVEYVQRTTRLAEEKMDKLGYKNWVMLYNQKKWRLAGRVSQSNGGRWSKRLLNWRQHFRCHPYRDVGRPFRRWGDSVIELAGGDWLTEAANASLWSALEHGFTRVV